MNKKIKVLIIYTLVLLVVIPSIQAVEINDNDNTLDCEDSYRIFGIGKIDTDFEAGLLGITSILLFYTNTNDTSDRGRIPIGYYISSSDYIIEENVAMIFFIISTTITPR